MHGDVVIGDDIVKANPDARVDVPSEGDKAGGERASVDPHATRAVLGTVDRAVNVFSIDAGPAFDQMRGTIYTKAKEK